MRKKLLFYLFIFTLLFAVFMYVNDTKILEDREEKIKTLEANIEVLKKENDSLINRNNELDYFSLVGNEDAITYFENQGLEAQAVVETIHEEIINRNRAVEDNDLVPFQGMEGAMRINKVKILNHKWIIADFTDGTYWGEILLSYDVDDKGGLNLHTEKSFLYPKN